MEDRFENFIEERRAEFDDKNPPGSVWQNIESKLKPASSNGYLRYWQVAAVVFFVISLGLVIRSYQPSTSEPFASDNLEEFRNTEEYYFQVIESQQGVLTSYLKQYPDLTTDFKNDLIELSQNYDKLKKDFEATGESEVLNALIKNLQLQQELLSNQLNIIQQIEEENESVSI